MLAPMTTPTESFVLLADREVREIGTRIQHFRHRRTGAEVLNMINDDENKAFGIAFSTPAMNSTGIAHILEHSVLAGSRNYPVREPFVELIKGSLNTFVNAMTWPDFTLYPVASQNTRDLYNLVDVYLDAVFYPSLTPWTLMQEGWHYELDEPERDLRFKGVVYNEMKGNYSSPDEMLWEYVRRSLFPDTPYAFDAGGDPQCIPDLDYEQFRRFHRRFYHPANSRIIWYGDDDPNERLRYLDGWLSSFDATEVEAEVPLQPRWNRPVRVVRAFDSGEEGEDAGAYVAVSWLLTEYRDPLLALSLEVAAHLLSGTPAAPMYKALIDSGLGEEVLGGGIDTDTRESVYAIGLKGVPPDEAPQVETLILETLASILADGFAVEQIEASLNTIEFNLREANFGGFPRGIVYMIQVLQTWRFGGDPCDPLAFEEPLAALRQRLAAGEPVFENLLRDYLLDNPHRSTVTMLPDRDWLAQREAIECERLEAARAAMSEDEIARIVAQTRTLKQMQVTPDDPAQLAKIPSLRLADLDRRNKSVPSVVLRKNDALALGHDLPTRGIAYLDLGFDLTSLTPSEIPYAGLLGTLLLEMGTAREDFVALARRIGRCTGGIEPTALHAVRRRSHRSVCHLLLRGKSNVAAFGDLLAILREVLLETRFDNPDRFRQILLEEKSDLESSLVPDGRHYVDLRLRARCNPADWAAEQTGGVEYLDFLRRLVDRIERDWNAVVDDLERVRGRLVVRSGLVANLTAEECIRPQLAVLLDRFIESLPAGGERGAAGWPGGLDGSADLFVVPTQVNFVGKGVDLYAAGHRLHGAWLVAQHWLNATYLWERVRVQGGAYGGSAKFDPLSGIWTFLSYRDPNVAQTLATYDGAGRYLREHGPSPADIERTIIGVIGRIDTYQLPDAKAYSSMARYLTDQDEDSRQQLREEILGTSLEDFVGFGDVLDEVARNGHVAVIGSQQALEAFAGPVGATEGRIRRLF